MLIRLLNNIGKVMDVRRYSCLGPDFGLVVESVSNVGQDWPRISRRATVNDFLGKSAKFFWLIVLVKS